MSRPDSRTDLTTIRDALEALTDVELHALIVATNEAPRIAPSLLAWIEDSCYWEINRRVGRHYGLLPPEAAIHRSEDAVSIQAADALRASFTGSAFAPAALTFFDVLVEHLTGGAARKH